MILGLQVTFHREVASIVKEGICLYSTLKRLKCERRLNLNKRSSEKRNIVKVGKTGNQQHLTLSLETLYKRTSSKLSQYKAELNCGI